MAKGRPPRVAIPPLSDPRGFLAVSAADRSASLLHAFFPPGAPPPSSVSPLQVIPFSYLGDTSDFDRPFTLGELERVLSVVRSGSPGPDRVSYSMIKNLDVQTKLSLLEIYNLAFAEGSCPASWKVAKVFPLRKPAKPADDPAGYRPISLLSCVGKVMERLVLRRLLWHLDRFHLSSAHQFGFKAGHSTTEPLVRLVCDARRASLERQYTVIVFLDIRKAFDGVWHEAVLARLRLCGVSGRLYNWLSSFLADRSYELRVEDAVSTASPQVGVPQGSALSPRLFNLVMDGLGDCVPAGVDPGLFADDGTFWTSDPSLQGALTRMQVALDSLASYGDFWGLDISHEKSDFMIVGPSGGRRALPSADLLLKGQPIPQVRNKRILGLHLTDRLTWAPQVAYLRSTCSKSLSLLFSLSGTTWGADRTSLLQLYRALVQSRLNYAVPAWPDLPAKLLSSLEVIQNSALRAVTRLPRGTANAALQIETNVPPLHLQRELLTCRYLVKLKARFPALYASVASPPSWLVVQPRRDPVTFGGDTLQDWGVPEIVHQVDPELLTSRLPPWSDGHERVSFVCQWLAQAKEIYLPEQLRALSLERIAAIPADVTVFTDGSRRPEPVACGLGVFWPADGSSLCLRLPEELCITSVELYAILAAVRNTPPADHLLLCTDSQAALALLQDRDEPSQLVRTITDTVLSRFRLSTFLWVPSHCGIPGNEAADRAAVSALALQSISEVPLPRRDIDRKLALCATASWTEQWSSATTGRVLFSVKPTPGPWTYELQLTKGESYVLSAVRCGRARLPDYLFRIGQATSPDCASCRVLGDARHVLLVCPVFQAPRRTLQTTLEELGVPFDLPHLLGNGHLPAVTSGAAVRATLQFFQEIGLSLHDTR